MSGPGIEVVVFDLGGVLLRLNEARSTFGLEQDDSTFIQTWLMSESVRAFERGDIGEIEFAGRVRDEFELPYDGHEFLRRFRDWPDALYPGVTDLLDQIPGSAGTALLSNTNSVHWYHGDIDAALRPRIDHIFLSFETGLLKPDQDAFIQITRQLHCVPGKILLLDDNPLNITAAAQLGFITRLTRSMDDLRTALAEHSLTG